MPELTQEQVVERGVAARLLLSDERFKTFFDETKSLMLESIGNTLPTQTAEREALYHRYNALNDLLGIMQSYVDASEAILNLNKESDFD